MEKFNKTRLRNIQNIFEEKTGTKLSNEKTYVNCKAKQFALVAAMLLCFVSLSAFAISRFSDLDGDVAGFSSKYLGDGIFEITITNESDRDLKLQDTIKLMNWATAEEIEGDTGQIVFSDYLVEAQSKKTIILDLSKAYDIDMLEEPLQEGDWYYLVLTNNNFAFGQDWMCSINFEEGVSTALADVSTGDMGKVEKGKKSYYADLAYENWNWPTECERISSLYGVAHNGIFSDHINIAGELSDAVYAVEKGIVAETGFDSAIGNYIVIDLDEEITVKYGHLKKISVKEGETVEAGEKIGKLGQSGMATGPNLYFAVYVDGTTVNPLAE